MIRQPVQSSHIRSIGHDGTDLEVEFANGAVYRYSGVTPQQHADLIAAPSIGTHFRRHVHGEMPHQVVQPRTQERTVRGPRFEWGRRT